MDAIIELFSWVLNVESHLRELITNYGTLVYYILFAIIFCETGLVIMPFLPGDSLLFAAGALTGENLLNVWTLYISLMVAAIVGDTLNYSIGRFFSDKVTRKFGNKVLKKDHLDKSEEFFKKWGSWAIVLARFAPFLRTFVPFVAGASRMNYRTFMIYNVLGGFLWVSSFLWAGHFFGQLPFFKNNIKLLILGIIAVSLLPVAIGLLKPYLKKKPAIQN